MNKQLQAATNERLYCCRLQLDWYAQQVASATLPTRIIEIACGEGLRLQIIAAYRAYLTELSATYNGPETSFSNATALSAANIESAELNELLVLEAGDSWLSQLLNSAIQTHTSHSSTPAKGGDIVLFQATSEQSSVSIDTLQHSYLSLKKLIDTHRSHSEEW